MKKHLLYSMMLIFKFSILERFIKNNRRTTLILNYYYFRKSKKIPKTVISRCNLLKFSDLTNQDLENYCKKNNMNIDINDLK